MYEAWSHTCIEAHVKKNVRSAWNAKRAPEITIMGMITTGANVSAGWSFRKFGSNTVFRKVAYMWGPPTRSVMRRSTPPAVVFPREWTSGGTATRTAEKE